MRRKLLAVVAIALPLALVGCTEAATTPTVEATFPAVIEGETYKQAAERITDEYPTIQTISINSDPGNEEFTIWTLDEEAISGTHLNAKFGLPDDLKITTHLGESPYKPSAS